MADRLFAAARRHRRHRGRPRGGGGGGGSGRGGESKGEGKGGNGSAVRYGAAAVLRGGRGRRGLGRGARLPPIQRRGSQLHFPAAQLPICCAEVLRRGVRCTVMRVRGK